MWKEEQEEDEKEEKEEGERRIKPRHSLLHAVAGEGNQRAQRKRREHAHAYKHPYVYSIAWLHTAIGRHTLTPAGVRLVGGEC